MNVGRYIIGLLVKIIFPLILLGMFVSYSISFLGRKTLDINMFEHPLIHLADPNCISTLQPVFGDSPVHIPESLNYSELVLACMYHRYVTTIQTMCVEPKLFGAPDNGSSFVCVDNNLLPKGNCRVVLLNAEDKVSYTDHIEMQYSCHVDSYSDGKSFILSQQHSRWRSTQQYYHNIVDVLELNVRAKFKDDIRLVHELIWNSSLIAKINQISIKIFYDHSESSESGYKGLLNMLRGIYLKGFRIFFYDPDWNCVPLGPIKHQFLSCYSVYFIRKQRNIPPLPIIPQDNQLHNMSSLQVLRIYDRFLSSLHIMCQQNIRVGNIKDGGWNVCHDRKYRPKPPCLIYSFGINNDWSFDEQVSKTYGCNVYAFDPSIGLPNHQHSSRVWFYNIGIGGRNHISPQNWTLMTLDSIVNTLHHTERIIDIVKMDVEGAEWDSIQQMVDSGILKRVRQLYLEFHSAYFVDRLSLVRKLYDVGFRIFWTHKNPWHLNFLPLDGGITSAGFETYFINSNLY